MPHLPLQRGVTLIEVLVAVLIFSVGIAGASSLLVLAARSSHAAYVRTQVVFLAQNMAERMQANLMGVWQGSYDGSYPDASRQDCAAGCTPAQLARHDRGLWSSQLVTFLPPPVHASIACSHAGLAYVPTSGQVALRPPYGGDCKMEVSWSERGSTATASDEQAGAQQTFAWEFQP
ncbi:type IV pilus modification protein PilV [Dyella mobilis]|uniref:Type IV pilus modification protein PilV n=1 Tax=Dyella mobilis TaxID=1849582 RepID=A0ABS2KKR6_9GAMM|nr:type IV pilus modification protein PilV [Dyella mobilis]MBM7131515.1 type IV pilus modification protein PilV [Dyella mobilis]